MRESHKSTSATLPRPLTPVRGVRSAREHGRQSIENAVCRLSAARSNARSITRSINLV